MMINVYFFIFLNRKQANYQVKRDEDEQGTEIARAEQMDQAAPTRKRFNTSKSC